MEEEVGIKVTRLRRKSQLPAENEDTKSPSTQSTPTKKRGGRLATKPQLEFIDENGTEGEKPKKARKSIARDIENEETPVTPSRRSTRIRSNTSNVSDVLAEPEDKVTPSRRSNRIRSNTSIVAETTSYDSPRARRAARRTSQIGSDNESTVTPARQARRTRKESTSSIDKQVDSNLLAQTSKVIVEEIDTKKSYYRDSTNDRNDSSTIRASPKFVEKSDQISISTDDNKENQLYIVKELNKDDKSIELRMKDTVESITTQNEASEDTTLTSSNLTSDVEIKFKNRNTGLNKSLPGLNESKPKRHRTKSWTTISSPPSDSYFMSDSEVIKKKNKKKVDIYNSSIASGSGDGVLNSTKQKAPEYSHNEQDHMEGISSHKGPGVTSVTENSVMSVSTAAIFQKRDKSKGELRKLSLDKISSLPISDKDGSCVAEKILGTAPSGHIESIVYIDDSDSNISNNEKFENVNKESDGGDQCVPIIKHQLEGSESHNHGYEPMDIDETMPENISLSHLTENNTVTDQSKRDSILKSPCGANIDSNNTESRSTISNLEKDNQTNVDKSKRESVTEVTSDLENSVNMCTVQDTKKSFLSEEASNNSIIKRKSISTTIKENDNVAIDDGKNNYYITSKRKSSVCNAKHDNTMDKVVADNYTSVPGDDNITNSSLNNTRGMSHSECNTQSPSSIHQSKKNIVTAHIDDNESTVFNEEEGDTSMRPKKHLKEIVNKNSSKSKRKSSTNETSSNGDNNPNVTEIDSLVVDVVNKDESMKKSSNKNKSYLSNIEDDNTSANISSRKSPKSSIKKQSTHKECNEIKNTLILSQITNEQDAETEYNEKLSKSFNIPNLNKSTDKKNLSLSYSTSTPLQQNSKKKLGLHLNTSIVAPSSAQSKEKAILTAEKKESHSSRIESSSEEDSDEEESVDVHINKEAEEASDDYESGDSRDEFEKKYEKQNEIVEKGETLDSEEDLSDDSEYEKDSFIVDSDEEDNDLLSGSGDDLSMSADELNMSAQSKMKFNRRKIKEQKKASREMFESRHRLNESDKNEKSNKTKSKKVKRLESSDSEFEDQVSVPLNKKRARIDSSQEVNITRTDANESIFDTEKKGRRNKVKLLSESDFEDGATNEEEISIQQNIETEKEDPLLVRNIKEEPNTSKRDLNISIAAIMNAEEIKEVDVDENVSIFQMNSNETSDPLHTTVNQNYLINSDESISENEEITQNYESVLNDLNTKSKNHKTLDLSLNLSKKTKKKAKNVIIDELNLTDVKPKKNDVIKKDESKKNAIDKSLTDSSIKRTTIDIQDEDSSNSIDMKLLFDEDSNESEIKGKIENEKVSENFIPLKRTEGKTNILESDNRKDEDLKFFIDTTGTHTDVDNSITDKTSAKKKKRKSNSISFTNIEEVQQDNDSNDAPLEVSYHSEKNKRKSKDEDHIHIDTLKASETPSKLDKTKKKEKKDLDISQTNPKEQSIEDFKIMDNEKSTSKNRKRKHSANQSIVQVDQEDINVVDPTKSFNEPNHKKKRKIDQQTEDHDNQIQELQKDTKQGETDVNDKNKPQDANQFNNEDVNILDASNTVNKSKQKKKRKIVNKTENIATQTQVTEKKNKKRKERDSDDGYKMSKINKQNSFDKVYVPRLPNSLIKELDEKANKNIAPKTNLISTASFKVEETRKRKNKPSNYLEQSVYLNDSLEEKRKKSLLKKPKVLPFIPTASTSDCGFTTNFKVNVLPQVTQFVAQSNDVSNFKIDYLQNNRIKKLGTFEKYKRHRNMKLSKF